MYKPCSSSLATSVRCVLRGESMRGVRSDRMILLMQGLVHIFTARVNMSELDFLAAFTILPFCHKVSCLKPAEPAGSPQPALTAVGGASLAPPLRVQDREAQGLRSDFFFGQNSLIQPKGRRREEEGKRRGRRPTPPYTSSYSSEGGTPLSIC